MAPAKNGNTHDSECNLRIIARSNGETVGKNNIPTVGKMHELIMQGWWRIMLYIVCSFVIRQPRHRFVQTKLRCESMLGNNTHLWTWRVRIGTTLHKYNPQDTHSTKKNGKLMERLKLGSSALIYTGPDQNELYFPMHSTRRNLCRLHFRTNRATQTGNHKQRVRHMMAHVFCVWKSKGCNYIA